MLRGEVKDSKTKKKRAWKGIIFEKLDIIVELAQRKKKEKAYLNLNQPLSFQDVPFFSSLQVVYKMICFGFIALRWDYSKSFALLP